MHRAHQPTINPGTPPSSRYQPTPVPAGGAGAVQWRLKQRAPGTIQPGGALRGMGAMGIISHATPPAVSPRPRHAPGARSRAGPWTAALTSPFGLRRDGLSFPSTGESTSRCPPAHRSGPWPRAVAFAGTMSGYGTVIVVDHGRGVRTVYAHLSEIRVQKGQAVAGRPVIGLSGPTGRDHGAPPPLREYSDAVAPRTPSPSSVARPAHAVLDAHPG
jgi:hypothetical protein